MVAKRSSSRTGSERARSRRSGASCALLRRIPRGALEVPHALGQVSRRNRRHLLRRVRSPRHSAAAASSWAGRARTRSPLVATQQRPRASVRVPRDLRRYPPQRCRRRASARAMLGCAAGSRRRERRERPGSTTRRGYAYRLEEAAAARRIDCSPDALTISGDPTIGVPEDRPHDRSAAQLGQARWWVVLTMRSTTSAAHVTSCVAAIA